MPIGDSRSIDDAFSQESAAKRAGISAKPSSIPLDTEMRAPTSQETDTMNAERINKGGDRFSNIFPVADPKNMAASGTQAIASLLADPKERAGYFAIRRFPHLSKQDALSRYGVQDGRIYYEGDDGKYYFEEPGISANPSEVVKNVASSAGPALPLAGSIVGGMATMPVAGGVPGAALGASAGDEIRQLLAIAFGGQKDFSTMQTAGEAAGAAVGQAGGIGIGKLIEKNAARDLARIKTPEAQAKIDELSGAASDLGVSLTPAEKTNLKSLKGKQNILGDLPESSDTMADFYTKRNTEQVPAAVEKTLGKISPVQSVEVGAENLKKGAKDVLSSERKALQKKAGPLYDEAYKANQSMESPTIDLILDTPAGRQALKKAATKMQNDRTLMGVNDQDLVEQAKLADSYEGGGISKGLKLRTLDYVKRSFDDMIGAAKKESPDDARILTNRKNELLAEMDRLDVTAQAGPKSLKPEGGAYKRARATYEEGVQPITAMTENEIGIAAKSKGLGVAKIPATMFESGPLAVASNRAAYVKAGKEAEWNDGLRSHLAQRFDAASKEFASGNANPGAKFRANVFGTPKQKATMRQAMSTEQWVGFNRLMDVLEATGRVQQGGSRTAFAGEGIAGMKKEAGGIVSKGIRAVSPSNLLDTSRIASAYDNLMLGKHAEKLADIITSKEGMSQLKALKSLSPNSKKAMAITSQLLVQFGIAEKSAPADSVPSKNSPYSLPYSPLPKKSEQQQ